MSKASTGPSTTAGTQSIGATAASTAYGLLSSAGTIALDFTSRQLQPIDPFFEQYKSKKTGQMKWRRRPLPPGLNASEKAALRDVRKRAHFLDEGYSKAGKQKMWKTNMTVKMHRFCVKTGIMVHGRQSIIEVTGDVRDVLLHYSLVMRPAMKLGIPPLLRHRMLLNYALAANAPTVPIIGSHLASAVKPNSRNAMLFEDFLIRKAMARQNKTPPKQEAETPTAATDATQKEQPKAEQPANGAARPPPPVKSTTLLYAKGKGDGGDEDEEAPEAEVASHKIEVPAASKADKQPTT